MNEALFPAMREIGAKADRLLDEHRKAMPRFGTLAMGSSWYSPFIIGDSLLELLSRLRKGDDIDKAVEAAKAHARFIIFKWNENPRGVSINGKHELCFWDGHADDAIESAHRLLHRAVGERRIEQHDAASTDLART